MDTHLHMIIGQHILNVKMVTHPDDLWLPDVPFSRWETVLLLDPSSYETATQSVGNPRQRNQASRRKKKRKKNTHQHSINTSFYSLWYEANKGGVVSSSGSRPRGHGSKLGGHRSKLAKPFTQQCCWTNLSPPTRRFAKEGKRSGSYMTSPINPYISLLTYITRDCRPARPNTVWHPYFCKDTAHETSHVCVFKKILTLQWNSILTVQTWILWLSVRVPDEE